MILKAEKPMIMAGGGVILSGAFSELQTLAELLSIPVVTTFKGKGAFPENHPLALGPIGMHGHAEANKMVQEADCILAIGARFSDRTVGRFDEFGKDINVIHFDVDPAEIGKNKSVNAAVIGDVKSSLRSLIKLIPKNFKTNDEIPRSGVYRVFHAQHPMREICLLKDKTFPACPQCLSPIRFALISAIPIESARGRFRLLMQARYKRPHVLLEVGPNNN